MSDRARRVAVLAAWLGFAAGCGPGPTVRPAAGTPAPVALAYGGAPGAARRWTVAQTWRGQLALGGMPQLVVLTFAGTLEERVESVAPDGSRRVRLTTDLEPPVLNGLPLDDAQAPRHAVVEFDRSPDGTVTTLGESETRADALAWTARVLAGAALALPDGPVVPGAAWTRSEPLAAVGGGVFTVTATGVLARVADGAAEVTTGLVLALAGPPPGAPVSSLAVDAGGTARFDVAAGALRSSDQSGLVVFRGAGRGGVEGRLRFVSTMAVSATAGRP